MLRRPQDLSIFFNEINGARPQVHSVLLRLMAELIQVAISQIDPDDP